MRTFKSELGKYLRVIKIVCLISLFLIWQTFLQLLGLFTELNLLSQGSSWSFINLILVFLCCLFTLYTILLYTPIGLSIARSFSSVDRWFSKRVAFCFIAAGFCLTALLIILIEPIKTSFSIHRLIPLVLWLFSLSAVYTLSIIIRNRNKPFLDIDRIHIKVIIILIAAFFCLFFLPYLIFTPVGEYFTDMCLKIFLFLIQAILGAELLKLLLPGSKFSDLFAIVAILSATALIIAQNLMTITSYPFSLDWSEGKWLQDASLVFSTRVYGTAYSIQWSEPIRILLQSVPFLLSKTPSLTFLRFWQCSLTLLIPAIASFVFIYQLRKRKAFPFFAAFFWFFITFFIGPTKFYLILVLIPLALLPSINKYLLTCLLVVIASVLVPPTRFNWISLPGCMAAFIYLLDTKYERRPIKYLWKPLSWILLGTAVSLGCCLIYFRTQVTTLESFSAVISSPLLFNRLFVTGTNILGILPSSFIISLPVIVTLYIYLSKHHGSIAWIRTIFLLLILTAFYLGGMVISIKIGGGNNLHNLDGYLLFSTILVIYTYWDLIQPDRPLKLKGLTRNSFSMVVIALIPAMWVAFNTAKPIMIATPEIKVDQVQVIQEYVNASIEESGKPALFIYQGQLIATHLIRNVEPSIEFDNVQLMEASLTGSESVLQDFYTELIDQTWSVILVPPLNIKIQETDHPFSEEHNLWVEKIVNPLLCFYQPAVNQLDFDYELLVPIDAPAQCQEDLLP